MPSVGPQMATVGTGANWTNPNNVGSATLYASESFELNGGSPPAHDYEAYISLNGTTTVGTNKAANASWTESAVDQTWGSDSELWGRSWSLADVKGNANFAIALAVSDDGPGVVTSYIFAKGFDFSAIPDGSTIAGVSFTASRKETDIVPGVAIGSADVRNVRCTVTYTGGGGGGSVSSMLGLLGVG